MSGRFLDEPPEAAVRVLALSLLDEACAAAARLRTGEDGDALHDFRVALRRLRTLCKAYEALLASTLPKKRTKALRALAASTGAARDAEVQLEWLEAHATRLKPSAKRAHAWLVATLTAQRDQAYDGVRSEALRRFTDLEAHLRRDLSRYEARIADAQPTFALTLAETLEEAAVTLCERLAAITSPTDVEPAHAARISGKRLRYLLEPLKKSPLADRAAPLLSKVKELQDVLGDLHDVHVLADELARVTVETAAERALTLHKALYDHSRDDATPELRGGLLAIAALVRDDTERLFAALQATWTHGGETAFRADLAALCTELRRRAVHTPKRRFLLARVPEIAAVPITLELGWLKGSRVKERLTRVDDGPCWRSVKVGKERIDEPIDHAHFDRLWPLTEGRRLRKLRYQVEEWTIDVLTDRSLVLLEAEHDAFPAWLREHVVREVTSEPAFADESLRG